MKTKKQLFEAAMKGPNLEYNTLLQLLDAITDIRNLYITCVLEEDGVNVGAVKAEMRRVWEAEVEDGKITKKCKYENCVYRDSEARCRFKGKTLIENGKCKSYEMEAF